MKYIIIEISKKKALYGVNNKTLTFSTKEIAEEVARQFFKDADNYMVIEITGLE